MKTLYTVKDNVVKHVRKIKKPDKYILEDGDIWGEPPCEVGCDVTTGLPPVPTGELLIALETAQLKETIKEKKLRDMDYTAELSRLNEIDPI